MSHTTGGQFWSNFGSEDASTAGTPSSLGSGGTDPLGVRRGAPVGSCGYLPSPGVGACQATVLGQDSDADANNAQEQLIREATNVLTDGGFEDFR